jgi:hypothetical protein
LTPFTGGQSTSAWHVAQYARGRQTVCVCPIDRFVPAVVTFGCTFTVAHHHPPRQSVSSLQLKKVQNAEPSVFDVP